MGSEIVSHAPINAQPVHICKVQNVHRCTYRKKRDPAPDFVYKMYMLMDHDPALYAEALDEIDAKVLGARIEVARLRKYETKKAAIEAMRDAADDPEEIKPRIYYLYEAGERRPKMSRLRFFADFFGVPLGYLLLGEGAEIYETAAREIAVAQRTILGIDALGENPLGGSILNAAAVNQDIESIESKPIHNQEQQYRVILTASEIRSISTGRGDLTAMSGQTLAVPAFLEVSRQSFWYRLPLSDVSMTGEKQSFNAGGIGLYDRDARILPGDFVLVDLKGWDEPVLRRYVAARAYARGASFRLEALNPAYEPIDVPAEAECRLIARLMFFGNRF